MSDLVNILNPELLGKKEKKVPWIESAVVTFLADVPGDFTQEFQAKTKELGDLEAGYWSAIQTIVEWNFSDEKGEKLAITVENFKRLPLKLQKWLFKQAALTMSDDEDKKKELPAN